MYVSHGMQEMTESQTIDHWILNKSGLQSTSACSVTVAIEIWIAPQRSQ